MPVEDERQLEGICFSEDGSRLFAASKEGEIYEIDREKGEGSFLMLVDTVPDGFRVWEHYMVVRNHDEGVFLYDMDTLERITDDVLSDFVGQNCGGIDGVDVSTYDVFPAEKDGLYLVCRKGLYRHVVGGAAVEQVINGGLTSLMDPSKHVRKMIRTGDERFLTIFSEGKISAFAYDPNIPTAPAQTLRVYSLTESDILRQAMIRYQAANPDVYVEYRVGMEGESGVTREDAVKKLNAEILAGSGPDFLLLDGLPADSYVEQGILADISPCLTALEKEEKLLPNIKESFTTDGKILMFPAAVSLPMYMTDQKYMTDVSDLSSLAELFETLREAYPGEEIMNLNGRDMIFNTLLPVSAPLWVTESGQINEEELSEFLVQSKRIYDACLEGLPEEILGKYREREENGVNVVSTSEVAAYNDLQDGIIMIAGGQAQIAMGSMDDAYLYAFLQSVKKMEDGESFCPALLPGSVDDVFCPIGLMGISAVSDKAELAEGFLQTILSGEMQSVIYPRGLPVNEEGLSSYLQTLGGMVSADWPAPDGRVGTHAYSADDGEMIVIPMYLLTEQEKQTLHDTLASVHTPYVANGVLEEAVREAWKSYLNGQCSTQEAVEAVREKLAIYMAE